MRKHTHETTPHFSPESRSGHLFLSTPMLLYYLSEVPCNSDHFSPTIVSYVTGVVVRFNIHQLQLYSSGRLYFHNRQISPSLWSKKFKDITEAVQNVEVLQNANHNIPKVSRP
ncbi:hypothetical protein AVEN_41286-1 [Araneus ventricosus]|uniref:Uncharacterized protein n=1 Tax=Araneus ventricosus TaxID=182803 RepID=A0A4Y2M806_ARAVE|nr:hypothetical protein AVEN_41286-1 [Araneus ventricosus]